MGERDPGDVTGDFEAALRKEGTEQYVLRLYIAGNNLRSQAAIENVKKICEENLKGRYELEIIDVYTNGAESRADLVIAAPTLIKKLPLPLRRIIGDMREKEKVLIGLDLIPRKG